MKKIILTTLIPFFLSCSSDETEQLYSNFNLDGYYKIESMISNELVDLNNDTILNNDLKEEIPNYFNTVSYDLIVKTLSENDPFEYLFGIYLPFPNEYIYLGTLNYGRAAIFKRFNTENHSIIINEYNKNTELDISLDKITVVENNIKMKIFEKFYDFKTEKWKILDVKISFTKIN